MKNKTKQKAGRLGGLATFERHGSEHMRKIGKNGATTTWNRYLLHPYGQTQYAMVSRATGKIIKVIGSGPRIEEILGE